jgi:hypothetical protein
MVQIMKEKEGKEKVGKKEQSKGVTFNAHFVIIQQLLLDICWPQVFGCRQLLLLHFVRMV